MSRVASNRTIARALLKTLGRLEADPSIDQHDSAFIHLKCTLLLRLLDLELDAAETQSGIHLVEPSECGECGEVEDDSRVA